MIVLRMTAISQPTTRIKTAAPREGTYWMAESFKFINISCMMTSQVYCASQIVSVLCFIPELNLEFRLCLFESVMLA